MAENKTPSIFSKENYMWMLVGIAVIAIGMFLMAGGGSDDPAVFNKDEVYSTTSHHRCPYFYTGGTGDRDICHF